MKINLLCNASLCIVISSCMGCCKISQPEDSCVSSIVQNRIDKQVRWNQGCCEDEEISRIVRDLLQCELTVDTSIQIALLNNPNIQATFEEIGIAKSDLVQAGLLQNPVLNGVVRFPNQSHATLNPEFSIVQNFLDILLIPLRKKIAEAEFEQAQLKVANAVLDLSFEVRETFYHLQEAQSKVDFMNSLVEVAEAVRDLAKGQKLAGNINDLDLQSREGEYLMAKTELSRSQNEIIRHKEKMNRLLGLRTEEICWRINSDLGDIPEYEVSLDCLEEVAISQRLDLEIARWEVERIARMYGIKQWWSYTGAMLGVSTETDPEGITSTGPAFSVEIPLFNYGQADRARIIAMFRQSLDRFSALEIQVLSEVRSARDQLMVNREVVAGYKNEIIPLQERIISISQEYYNYMALSVYKLLSAKKQELQIRINFTSMLRDYWISRVDLDRALGGNLYVAEESYNRSSIMDGEGSE